MSVAERQVIELEVETRIPQQRHVWQSASPYMLYLGGVGAGKTFTGALWSIGRPSGHHVLIVAPTYKNLLSGALATMLPMLYGSRQMPDDVRRELSASDDGHVVPRNRIIDEDDFGPAYSLVESYNKQDGELRMVDGKLFIFRSLDRPELVRGANVNDLWIDEPGIIRDESTYNILLARVRRTGSKLGQRLGTTTPPLTGKNHWLYKRFVEGAVPGVHEVVTVKTRDNPYNPPNYESDLRREFADAYAARELDAEWIDLGEINVYDVAKIVATPYPPDGLVRTARGWDTAATAGAGDYTAGVLMSIDKDGNIYIRDVVRGQWAPAERDAAILNAARADGISCMVALAKARGDSGVSQMATWAKLLAGFRFRGELESGEKVVRAGPLAALMGAGKVHVTAEPGRWENYWHDGKRLSAEAARRKFSHNLGLFPIGRTKDESDAAYQALQAITKRDTGIAVGRYDGSG